MPEVDLSRAAWQKSSYSSQDGNCVEVALNLPAIVVVRDSKDPDGPSLIFTARDWGTFVAAFRRRESCFG